MIALLVSNLIGKDLLCKSKIRHATPLKFSSLLCLPVQSRDSILISAVCNKQVNIFLNVILTLIIEDE